MRCGCGVVCIVYVFGGVSWCACCVWVVLWLEEGRNDKCAVAQRDQSVIENIKKCSVSYVECLVGGFSDFK